MPFFMAIPTDTPDVIDGIGAPVVSAGPYFIREWTKNRRIVLERNRYYRGPRPHRVSRIHVDIGLPLETIKLNIDSGRADTGDIPAAAHAELGDRFGVRRRSPGRYFANPTATILYLAFNHDRPLFGGPTPLGNIRLKKAINFAIDRRALMNQYGAHAGTVHDQLLPPTIRGFRDVSDLPSPTGPRPGSRARRGRAAEQHPGNALLHEPLAVAAGLPARPGESARSGSTSTSGCTATASRRAGPAGAASRSTSRSSAGTWTTSTRATSRC